MTYPHEYLAEYTLPFSVHPDEPSIVFDATGKTVCELPHGKAELASFFSSLMEYVVATDELAEAELAQERLESDYEAIADEAASEIADLKERVAELEATITELEG